MVQVSCRRRRGFSFMEILVAVAIFSILVMILFSIFNSGMKVSRRAFGHMLAVRLARRVMDQVRAKGYDQLASQTGLEQEVGASDLNDPEALVPGPNGGIVCDGVTFNVIRKLDLLEPGLLRIGLTVTWTGIPGSPESSNATLDLFDYLADNRPI